MEKKSTIFCDIDGTIFVYRKFANYTTEEAQVIPSTLEYLQQQKAEGNMIILTTARPESLYLHTVAELEKNSIPYDKLIMGIERGPRYLINDMDPDKPGLRAIAYNLIRNEGISNVE